MKDKKSLSPFSSELEDWCEEISKSKDYLFQDRLLSASASSEKVQYSKRDFLHKPGIWRGKAHPRLLASESRKFLLVGHSDYSTTIIDVFRLRLRGEKSHIFAQNLAVPTALHQAFSVSFLPLGLTSPTNESASHQILGNFEDLSSTVEKVSPPDSLNDYFPYASFDVSTSRGHREEVARICKKLEHVKFDEVDHSREGRLRFLAEARRNGLVVCPRGNGHDTHRFYEALYLGALPIVLKRDYSARLARYLNLPHIALRDWRELANLEKLRASARETLNTEHNLNVLAFTWWSKMLANAHFA